jgi:hypothetical protein
LLLTDDHFHVTLSLVHDVPHMFVLLLGRITTLIGEQDGALRLLCACSARMPAAAAAAAAAIPDPSRVHNPQSAISKSGSLAGGATRYECRGLFGAAPGAQPGTEADASAVRWLRQQLQRGESPVRQRRPPPARERERERERERGTLHMRCVLTAWIPWLSVCCMAASDVDMTIIYRRCGRGFRCDRPCMAI